MRYYNIYQSPIGKMKMIFDEDVLICLKFYNPEDGLLSDECMVSHNEIIDKVTAYLDNYFRGLNPKINFKFRQKTTDFQDKIFKLTVNVPYGKTKTYNEIANEYYQVYHAKTSPRAIGQVEKKNHLMIIVPCHRIIGKNGLTGYAGGLDKKLFLLRLENNKLKY